MEELNHAVFLLINAASAPGRLTGGIALALAEGAIWLVPGGLIWGWLRGSRTTRAVLLSATLAALLGLAANQAIGYAWYHPRPFELGIGHAWLSHARDSSFPSDHLTVVWSVAFSLLARRRTRAAGSALGCVGVAVAWARIFLGVHFPLDMAGSALVAAVSAALVRRYGSPVIAPFTQILVRAHGNLLAPWIRRGWVRK